MSDYTVLPEITPPPGVEACAGCELSRQRARVIWAEGNPHAPVMIVLDNPGAREDTEGDAFVCGTRQTLQDAALEAGLRREDMYVTWVLKCRPRRAYDKEGARAACLPYFAEQVSQVKPRIVMPLGNVALQAVLGDPEAEVKNLRGRVFEHNGQRMVCSYHPLAARRRPNLKPYLVEDLKLAILATAACP